MTDAAGRFTLFRHREPHGQDRLRLVITGEIAAAPDPEWNAPARDFVARRPGEVDLLVVDASQRPVLRSVQRLGGGKPERVQSLGGHRPGGRASLGSCSAGKRVHARPVVEEPQSRGALTQRAAIAADGTSS